MLTEEQQEIKNSISIKINGLKEAQKILNSLDMNEEYRSLLEKSLLKLFNHSQRIAALYQSDR